MSETILSRPKAGATAFSILAAVSLCHLLNDLIQSLLPAIYPILKDEFTLSFAQVGLLTLTYQITASLLQPLVGLFTDRRPMAYSLAIGMGASLVGLVILAFAPNYPALVAGGMLLGLGSSIFHPEASRIARLASGGAHGLAQSLFQVGGNFGSALGPLLAAFVILPHGQASLAWFALVALGGIAILTGLGRWYQSNGHARPVKRGAPVRHADLTAGQVWQAMAVLVALIVSKYVYLASITSYYTFYLMERFQLPTETAQLCLFVFLAAVATGTVIGGPVGDRIGRKTVIWVSILGILPFTLALPYVGLTATVALSAIIGLALASAFPAIVVYAQELMPGRVGTVSGLFFGLAFGVAGIGAAGLGLLADRTGIDFVYTVCSFLPLLGLLTVFLPNVGGRARR
ncbi:FSR family fosmidomycin resistance protein-like MFS transporter [Azospirillum agricola]|uniref:MFS transporter n=1 Tax=Azospirillum agricola TaxID=1720247 RepID=UPI001AE440DC|nr:MFS transporter [Azospirillum agricola]MBP2229547.1 FSR family fosmidomycin resistance protein-like MFS transporter [Azospirillum agricola]